MEHLPRECMMNEFRELLLMSGASLTVSFGVIFALVGFPL